MLTMGLWEHLINQGGTWEGVGTSTGSRTGRLELRPSLRTCWLWALSKFLKLSALVSKTGVYWFPITALSHHKLKTTPIYYLTSLVSQKLVLAGPVSLLLVAQSQNQGADWLGSYQEALGKIHLPAYVSWPLQFHTV